MWEAVNKIDLLTEKMKGLEKQIDEQGEVIKELKASSSKDGSSSDGSKVCGASSRSKTCKSKADRNKEEKERQFRLLKERLKDKESSESGAASTGESEDGLNLKALEKKMGRKKKSKCKKREAALLKEAGARFPDQDFSATSSSGTDTDSGRDRCRHKRKVKSGAGIKKRPVVRTELWPHTVANEEDGEEVTCDSISLAKFYSCFTLIMLDCRRSESKGRTTLLHAVSLVLEALFWAEARTFHNLIMVKIEQDRLSWSDDFTALAEAFIDKKVRGSIKSKGTATAGKHYG